MQIDDSEEHRSNVPSSKVDSRDPDSNITVESDQHTAKQFVPSFPTEEGIRIEESDQHAQNAPSSIQESSEPASNVTMESN
jgi:hypothetical protein